MKCLRDLFKKKIKTIKINNKMANTYLSTTESKKLSKQEQKQNHGYGEHFDSC